MNLMRSSTGDSRKEQQMEKEKDLIPGIEVPTKKRKRFVDIKGGSDDYYEDVQDKYEAEKKAKRMSRAESDLIAAMKTGNYRMVTVAAERETEEFGPCAVCEYILKDAQEEEPVDVIVPADLYFPFIDDYLKEHNLGSRRVYIEKQADAEIDIIPLEMRKDEEGRTYFIADRVSAMAKKALELWFAVLVDGENRSYRFNVGSVIQSRVIGVSRSGALFDIMGKPVYLHLSALTEERIGDARTLYSVGDREMLKVTMLERDEGTGFIRVKAEREGLRHARELLYRRVADGDVRIGTVNSVFPKDGHCFVNMSGASVYCNMGSISCDIGDRVRVIISKRPKEEGDERLPLWGTVLGLK